MKYRRLVRWLAALAAIGGLIWLGYARWGPHVHPVITAYADAVVDGRYAEAHARTDLADDPGLTDGVWLAHGPDSLEAYFRRFEPTRVRFPSYSLDTAEAVFEGRRGTLRDHIWVWDEEKELVRIATDTLILLWPVKDPVTVTVDGVQGPALRPEERTIPANTLLQLSIWRPNAIWISVIRGTHEVCIVSHGCAEVTVENAGRDVRCPHENAQWTCPD